MKKIIIIGNSGSGKSTLAKHLVETESLAHLDLDTLAWLATVPPVRAPVAEVKVTLKAFIKANNKWVIEGCYTDLLELVSADANELVFMDLCVELCCKNAKNRPWEPHKYESKVAQDSNLSLLLAWIEDYEKRQDTFSYQAHTDFFENFPKLKTRHKTNAMP